MAEKNTNKNNNKPLLEEMVTIPKKEYEALKAKEAECGAYYDKYVRAHAEFENARKRIEKEKGDLLKYANEGFVVDLLPIIDMLEISEKHIKEAKDFKAVREGVDMIHVQIQKFLKDIGVEKIKSVGEKFDPNFHEAIETADIKDKEEGLVVEELKSGYTFNGRLLRPASVKIVKHGG
ncbi:MAG: nucleotide exchange factor GrpE [Candidatus Omnitrophota bacterium]|jgi:molecular chaperone GrpE